MDENEKAEPDPLTSIRSYITGSRVTPEQALQIARRSRTIALRALKPNAKGTGTLEIPEQRIGRILSHDGEIFDSPATGKTLRRDKEGAEASVFVDRARGVGYKVFGKSEAGSVGIRVALDKAGITLPEGDEQSLCEKVMLLNELGGVHAHEIFTEEEIEKASPLSASQVTPTRGMQTPASSDAKPKMADLFRSIIKGALDVNSSVQTLHSVPAQRGHTTPSPSSSPPHRPSPRTRPKTKPPTEVPPNPAL